MKPFPHVPIATDEDLKKVDSPSTKMALALNATQKPVYPGTVHGPEKAKRRKVDKAQRAARRIHRTQGR